FLSIHDAGDWRSARATLRERRPRSRRSPQNLEWSLTLPGHLEVVVPEIFISAVICAFHAAKSHSFRTPRLSFKRSTGRLAAKAGQNRRGIVPFARHNKIALRKGTPFLAIMRSSHLML